jgi:hypothetical protein
MYAVVRIIRHPRICSCKRRLAIKTVRLDAISRSRTLSAALRTHQKAGPALLGSGSYQQSLQEPTPKTIMQFWHDLGQLPLDLEQCVRSWTVWESRIE